MTRILKGLQDSDPELYGTTSTVGENETAHSEAKRKSSVATPITTARRIDPSDWRVGILI
jgi:hypothetical protein